MSKMKILISCELGDYYFIGMSRDNNICMDTRKSKGMVVEEKDCTFLIEKIKHYFENDKMAVSVKSVKEEGSP